jgi:tetratricopeptide (TPR) repeat protein
MLLAELLWATDRRVEAGDLFRQMQEWVRRISRDDASGHDMRAWFLVSCPDPRYRDPQRALKLAKRATQLAPSEQQYGATLGAAYYRAGNWPEAVETLSKGEPLPGGSSWRLFFLAMAHSQLGHKDEARQAYDKAVQLMEKHEFSDRELRRVRAEAEQVLGIKETSK